MAVACVRILHFALRVAVLDRPELAGVPLVLGAPPGKRPLVVDRTGEAGRRGIRAGMHLREIPALCAEAVVCRPNPAREAVVAERLAARLETLSPLVASDPDDPGCVYVDLRGLDRHFGSPEAAAQRLLEAVPAVLQPRVGVAPGRFTARIAAGRTRAGTAYVVAPEDVPGLLAGVPVARLPLPLEAVRALERTGVRTLGDLAALPMPAVQARLGPAGRRAWELANGQDDADVRPPAREETVVERLTLPAPATSRETFRVALAQLVVRAFGRPALRQRHARQVRLRARIEGGSSWEQTLTLREPSGAERLIETLGLRLQGLEMPGPIETLTLELSGLIQETARQEPLLTANLRPRRDRQLVEAARQLKQRYGVSPLYRIVEVEPWSRIPERRHALISYDP